MAEKTIKVSDLSGELIHDEDQLGRLVVERPQLAERPITLDVLPNEIEGEIPAEGQDPVLLSYYPPRTHEPRRFVLPLEAFNRLSRAKDMESILKRALATQEKGRSRRRTRIGINYPSPAHAGEPHRGQATQAEQEYVRAHLDEVNARLRADGMREIDPNDPKMAKRYGLTPT